VSRATAVNRSRPTGKPPARCPTWCATRWNTASVDAKRRKIIWPDGKRLSIEQSAQRIEAEHPDMPRELIDNSLCNWLDNCVPKSFSERQIAELGRLVGPWICDHERKSSTAGK